MIKIIIQQGIYAKASLETRLASAQDSPLLAYAREAIDYINGKIEGRNLSIVEGDVDWGKGNEQATEAVTPLRETSSSVKVGEEWGKSEDQFLKTIAEDIRKAPLAEETSIEAPEPVTIPLSELPTEDAIRTSTPVKKRSSALPIKV